MPSVIYQCQVTLHFDFSPVDSHSVHKLLINKLSFLGFVMITGTSFFVTYIKIRSPFLILRNYLVSFGVILVVAQGQCLQLPFSTIMNDFRVATECSDYLVSKENFKVFSKIKSSNDFLCYNSIFIV